MAKAKTNESCATTTMIRATSRISLKQGETFYTVEYTEERTVPEGCDLKQERKLLWDTVNTEVDDQALDIKKLYKK